MESQRNKESYRKGTITACLIVRNEQDVLAGCLNNVQLWADEIVVLDTGSTDHTVKIAQQYTDNVFHTEWKDDFGAARDLAFSLATSEYIIWIDADEIIMEHDGKELCKLINQEKPPVAIGMVTVMRNEHGEDYGLRFRRERVVRRDLGAKWVGFIHEYLSIPHHLVEHTNLEVQHIRKGKTDPYRNLRIYENKIKQGYDFSQRDLYYYGKELYYTQQYQRAASVLEEFLDGETWIEDRLDTYVKLVDCYKALGWQDDLEETFRLGIETEPRAELVYRLAMEYIEGDMPNTALLYLEGILNMEVPVESTGFVDRNYWRLYPHIQLVVLYYNRGCIYEAYEHHVASTFINPDHPSVKHNEKFFTEWYAMEKNLSPID